MRSYKIKEFSQRSGISMDTLRYYEKIGVLSADRLPQNAYRSYTDHQLMEAFQLRFLRSVSAPLSDLMPERQPHSLLQICQQMDREAQDIETEIDVLQRRLKRVKRLREEIQECFNNVERCTRMVYPAMMAVYLSDHIDGPTADAIRAWTSHLPYVHLSFRIPEREICVSEPSVLNAQIGYGVLLSYARELKLPEPPSVEISAPTQGIRCILRVSDPFHPRYEEFTPFVDFLKENHLRAVGPWHYRLRFIDEYKKGCKQYYIALRVETCEI